MEMRDRQIWGLFAAAVFVPLGLALAAPPAHAGGDVTHGAQVFRRCLICHNVKSTEGNKIGPNLHGLFDRAAGKQKGFAYSSGIAGATFTWDDARLEKWLTDPQSFSPGAKMAFKVPDAKDRADVIAYLHQVTEEK
jgi:cytochrome c